MLGYFLTSKDGNICLVRLDSHDDKVKSLHYAGGMKMASLVMEKDLHEEMLTVDIAKPIHDSLTANKKILIVNATDDGKVVSEYYVPVDNT